MYHCHINFFFLGNQRKLFKILEGMPPLEHFTHEYFESKTPYESMISKADVIIADLEKMDAASTLQMLLSEKNQRQILSYLQTKTSLPSWQHCLAVCPKYTISGHSRSLRRN